MARATYIYIIRLRHKPDKIVSLHTVKHEAHTWAEAHHHTGPDRDFVLSRMRDGVHHSKIEEEIPWEFSE